MYQKLIGKLRKSQITLYFPNQEYEACKKKQNLSQFSQSLKKPQMYNYVDLKIFENFKKQLRLNK